ncbi:MAG: MBL fold metallo-hydrolase, partial [Elusimicrobiaceae bacterium]|nr:MBL fold metallo-hydrolase [Elusimicrobiaceae bacterium]
LEESDIPLAGLPPELLHTYRGDQQVKIGPFNVQILATPGHTAGGVCILLEDALFTGDTLFPGACGRVDLPSSNPRDMLASLRRIAALPEDTRIFAGHSYGGRCSSTVADEKLHNPYMRNALRWEEK